MQPETRRSFGAARLTVGRSARASPYRGLLLSAVGSVLLVLAACASRTPLRSQLDETGRTWISIEAPIALARPAPRFSHAARDYVYLAPVEANNAGKRKHYLWVGFGTTVDRRWPWAAAPDAQTLLLVLDGAPLTLPLEPWDAEREEAIYKPAAPIYAVRRASVSLDELTRISAAASVEAQVVAPDGQALTYELWSGSWSDWSAFVAGAHAERPLDAAR